MGAKIFVFRDSRSVDGEKTHGVLLLSLASYTLLTPFSTMPSSTSLKGNSHANARARPHPPKSRSFQGRRVDGGGNVSKIVDANVDGCRHADSDLLYTAPLRPPLPEQETTMLNSLPINYPVQSGLVGRVDTGR
jgi:hypothetical protein